jgi:glutathione-regulated potassium-efflux system ancillary protein KefC
MHWLYLAAEQSIAKPAKIIGNGFQNGIRIFFLENIYLLHSFIFLAATCCIVPLAKRFKLGSVLGYILTGFIIGPYCTGLMGNSVQVVVFAQFGVILMLFLIGLELEPSMLWRLRRAILGLGGMQIIFTSLLFAGIGKCLGYSFQLSLACGMALSLSSTAIALQILRENNLLQSTLGQYSFSVLLFQDIAVIPILIFIPLLVNLTPVTADLKQVHFSMSQHSFLILLAMGGLIISGKYLSRYLFQYIARSHIQEIFTATALALVIGITLVMNYIGMSPALGAFIGGVVLANSEYKHSIEADIQPFKGLLLGLFFVSIGMGINLQILMQEPITLLSIVCCLLMIKIFILFILGKVFKLPILQNVGFAITLSQGSEFAFVLFKYIFMLHAITQHQLDMLALAVTLSMATTPVLLIFFNEKIMPKYLSSLPPPNYDEITDLANPVIIAGYGRFGQIIGRFLHAQKIGTTILEQDADQIDLIRRFGRKAYYGDASRIDLLRNAGANTAKVLVIAIDDVEKSIQIAQLARSEFPQLKIFARARNRKHAYELFKAKVDFFRRETFDSSIVVAEEVMKCLGFSQQDVNTKTHKFIEHDIRTLNASFDFFDQEKEMISFAIKSGEELEQILNDDL